MIPKCPRPDKAVRFSAQTGLRVSCCQAGVAGIPWGLAEIFFEANDEPARSVLKRLCTAAAINQPDRDYWLQRCDPLPSAWCFINLAHISRENVTTLSTAERAVSPKRDSAEKSVPLAQ